MALKKNNFETKLIGTEPTWHDVDKLSDEQVDSRVLRSINWYNYFCSLDDYKEFVVEYLENDKKVTKNVLSNIKKLDKKTPEFRNIGALCKIKTLGGRLVNNKDQLFFDNNLTTLMKQGTRNDFTPESSPDITNNIKDNVQNKIKDVLNMLDLKIDEFSESSNYKEFLKTFNFEKWIVDNNIKPHECLSICDYFGESLTEKKEAIAGKDRQLVEAYSYMSKVKLKKLVEMISNIVEISRQYSMTKKERKPRKKKAKSPDVLVKKLKYQKTDEKLKLTSINPRDIIGATKLVVYNTRYNKVCIYECDRLDGFSVKGTSIQNITASKCKIVRKPEAFFNGIGGGMRSVANHYDALKTKESEASPRINENTILFRAFK